jgi:hypothetical protein
MAKLRVRIEEMMKDKVGDAYSAYFLQPNKIAEDHSREIYRKDQATIALRTMKPKADVTTISLANLRTLADDIDRSTYYGDYKDVKGDNEWQTLYDKCTKHVTVKFGSTWKTASADVIPCYYCGFATPLGLIEVDHWFEKGDDSERIQALLKIFRSLGDQLTVAAATGAKGSQVQAIMQAGFLLKLPTRNNGPTLDHGRLNAKHNNFHDQKRQLTDKGQLVLSAFFASWNDTTNPATFLKLFVNNFFNLVPACGACNKAKNNR